MDLPQYRPTIIAHDHSSLPQAGSLNKPSYSKDSLDTVAMPMKIIIITCKATVSMWLAVSEGSLL